MVHIQRKPETLSMDEREHIVYILKCKDETLYTGYTIDLEHRIKMHTDGKGAKYTRGRGPFEIVFIEKYPTKEEALQTEYKIKQLARIDKLQLIDDQSKGLINDASPKEF